MKKIIYLSFTLFILISCKNSLKKKANPVKSVKKEAASIGNNTTFYKMAHHWVLSSRTNLDKSKTIRFDYKDSKLVTHFESSGFYRTYDVIEMKNKQGYRKSMALRAIGQWKIYNNTELVLHFVGNDSTRQVGFYKILKLDSISLVLKNTEKGFIDSYFREDSNQ